MNLEKKSCEKCDRQFEDGNFLIKKDDKYYHYLLLDYVTSYELLMGASPCGKKNESGANLGIFYKGNFYEILKNAEKMKTILNELTCTGIENKEGILYGHTIDGDLSFLDNLEPD